MIELDQVTQMDCLKALADLPDQAVDVTLTDPPYPNRLNLFSDSIVDGYAGLYLACKKTKNYVVFFWSNDNIPQAPPGWYEVARHVWHKPDCKSITHYELIIVWSRDYKRKTSRVWSIPILDYRSLRDWKPHPTQKPVRLIRYLLEQYTKEGDTVLDPFVGTGTTAVACKQMRRHFIAIDNDPAYIKMATARLTTRSKQDDAAPQEATVKGEDAPPEDPDASSEDEIAEHAAQDQPIEDETNDEPAPDNADEAPPRHAARTTSRTPRPAQRPAEKPRRPPKPASRATPAREPAYAKR
uniref:Methyltransferase n=1 Tax=Solibacter usitatus (strain Ellin6076) TaxID=234267 RepID=Q023G2_SOLUE